MDEHLKLGAIDRDTAEKEMILKMHIQDWVNELRKSEPRKQKGENRLAFQSIIHLIRPISLSIDQKQLKHGKLYPWLRDVCGLSGIETVSDLVKVFQHAPRPQKYVSQEPWIWFGSPGRGSPSGALTARDLLIQKGLLQENQNGPVVSKQF